MAIACWLCRVLLQRHVVTILTCVRRSNALVSTTSLLNLEAALRAVVSISLTLGLSVPESALVAAVVWVAAAGAAAGGEEPEERGAPRESHAEPADSQSVMAEFELDAVVF